MEHSIHIKNTYNFECYDPLGKLKWVDKITNLVPTLPRNRIIDTLFNGGTIIEGVYTGTNSVYMGLCGATPTFSADDTMGSHDGWSEVEDYDGTSRCQMFFTSAENGATSNGANPCVFLINNPCTVGGAFICFASQRKGSTSGLLFGEGAFKGGDHDLISGDKIYATAVITLTSS